MRGIFSFVVVIVRWPVALAIISLVCLGFTSESTLTGSAHAQEPVAGVWTVVIPRAFPRYIYTWQLKPDGTYAEDGRDRDTDTPIQQTLTGRWTVEGVQMVLRQDGLKYVFKGLVVGNRYSGSLYLDAQLVSDFCAVRGKATVPSCKSGPELISMGSSRLRQSSL